MRPIGPKMFRDLFKTSTLVTFFELDDTFGTRCLENTISQVRVQLPIKSLSRLEKVY